MRAKSCSLPVLGAFQSNAEGLHSDLSKRDSTISGGAVGPDASAELGQVKLPRPGGWRRASEESRAQEVARHLEWAREMKASYERQVWAYEQELRRHHQRKAKKEELPVQTPIFQKENLAESPDVSPDPRPDGTSQPQHRKAKLSRRSKSKRRESSADARGAPSLNLVFRPAVRSGKGDGEFLLRQEEEPRLKISHLLRVKAAKPTSPTGFPESPRRSFESPELHPDQSPPNCVSEPLETEVCPIHESQQDLIQSVPTVEHIEPPNDSCQADSAPPDECVDAVKPKKSKKRKRRSSTKTCESAQESKSSDEIRIAIPVVPATSGASKSTSTIDSVTSTVGSESMGEVSNVSARKIVSEAAQRLDFVEEEPEALASQVVVPTTADVAQETILTPQNAEHPRAEAWRSIFRRLKDDGQLHTESLPLALQLAGFASPNLEWVDDILKMLTPYAALDIDEFVSFVLKYEEREHAEALVLFKRFDVNGNGRMEIGELTGVFESCGITPIGHTMTEIVNEVGAVDPSCLTFDEFWQVMLHLRVHEGFTKSEVREIQNMFARFDVRGAGALEAHELARVLCYMGYALDAATINEIVKELEVDEHGSVDEREFFACMRKIREREVKTMRQVFKDCDTDSSGGISVDELLVVLRTLGYFPELDDSLHDAARDVGVDLNEDMTFDQLWQFLEAYRRREGFSESEVRELRASFDQADTVKDGELDAFEVCQLFVRLGLPVSRTQVERFVANADIDGSGTINFEEYLKVFRQWRHHLSVKARRAYTDKSPADKETLRVLVPWASQSDLEYSGNRVADMVPDCEFKFVSLVTELQKLSRHQVKDNHGFGEPELEELKVRFGMFDTTRKGYLSDKEVQRLLETVCAELATSPAMRPQLLEIMKEATRHADGAMDFSAFLVLMRRIQEIGELDRIRREREAMRKVGFTDKQVLEFREFFMGNIDRETLSFDEVKDMFSNFIPMGGKNCDAVEQTFLEVASAKVGERTVDFAGFLLLLRRMMDLNVASINDCAMKACAGISELVSPGRRSSRDSSPGRTSPTHKGSKSLVDLI